METVNHKPFNPKIILWVCDLERPGIVSPLALLAGILEEDWTCFGKVERFS